jgi:hypothetical protein
MDDSSRPQDDAWRPEHWDEIPQTVRGHLQFHLTTAANDQRLSRLLEFASLIVSATIPVAAAVDAPAGVIAGLGALATVLVSILTRGRYRENWLRHNQIILAIQHELVLFDHRRQPYREVDGDRRATLALTVEELVQTEAASWAERERIALPRPSAGPDPSP